MWTWETPGLSFNSTPFTRFASIYPSHYRPALLFGTILMILEIFTFSSVLLTCPVSAVPLNHFKTWHVLPLVISLPSVFGRITVYCVT